MKTKVRKRANGNLGRELTCDICHGQFSRKVALEIHLRSHTGKKPYLCELCGKGFSQVGNLNKHRNLCKVLQGTSMAGQETGETDENTRGNPLQCHICTEVFEYKRDLKSHMHTHIKGETLHYCSLCDKKYRNKGALQSHLLIHNGAKPFHCEFCDKKFAQASQRNVHVRTCHNGERSYQCEDCKKCFPSKGNLQRHMSLHTGIKRFSCDVCKRKFLQKYELTKHLQNKGRAENNKCQNCDLVFCTPHDLRSHMKSHSRAASSSVKQDTAKISSVAKPNHYEDDADVVKQNTNVKHAGGDDADVVKQNTNVKHAGGDDADVVKQNTNVKHAGGDDADKDIDGAWGYPRQLESCKPEFVATKIHAACECSQVKYQLENLKKDTVYILHNTNEQKNAHEDVKILKKAEILHAKDIKISRKDTVNRIVNLNVDNSLCETNTAFKSSTGLSLNEIKCTEETGSPKSGLDCQSVPMEVRENGDCSMIDQSCNNSNTDIIHKHHSSEMSQIVSQSNDTVSISGHSCYKVNSRAVHSDHTRHSGSNSEEIVGTMDHSGDNRIALPCEKSNGRDCLDGKSCSIHHLGKTDIIIGASDNESNLRSHYCKKIDKMNQSNGKSKDHHKDTKLESKHQRLFEEQTINICSQDNYKLRQTSGSYVQSEQLSYVVKICGETGISIQNENNVEKQRSIHTVINSVSHMEQNSKDVLIGGGMPEIHDICNMLSKTFEQRINEAQFESPKPLSLKDFGKEDTHVESIQYGPIYICNTTANTEEFCPENRTDLTYGSENFDNIKFSTEKNSFVKDGIENNAGVKSYSLNIDSSLCASAIDKVHICPSEDNEAQCGPSNQHEDEYGPADMFDEQYRQSTMQALPFDPGTGCLSPLRLDASVISDVQYGPLNIDEIDQNVCHKTNDHLTFSGDELQKNANLKTVECYPLSLSGMEFDSKKNTETVVKETQYGPANFDEIQHSPKKSSNALIDPVNRFIDHSTLTDNDKEANATDVQYGPNLFNEVTDGPANLKENLYAPSRLHDVQNGSSSLNEMQYGPENIEGLTYCPGKHDSPSVFDNEKSYIFDKTNKENSPETSYDNKYDSANLKEMGLQSENLNNVQYGPESGEVMYGPKNWKEVHFGPKNLNELQYDCDNLTEVQFGHENITDVPYGPLNLNDVEYGPENIHEINFDVANLNQVNTGSSDIGDVQYKANSFDEEQFIPYGPPNIYDLKDDCLNGSEKDDCLNGSEKRGNAPDDNDERKIEADTDKDCLNSSLLDFPHLNCKMSVQPGLLHEHPTDEHSGQDYTTVGGLNLGPVHELTNMIVDSCEKAVSNHLYKKLSPDIEPFVNEKSALKVLDEMPPRCARKSKGTDYSKDLSMSDIGSKPIPNKELRYERETFAATSELCSIIASSTTQEPTTGPDDKTGENHLETSDSFFFCDVCNQMISCKQDMSQHILEHSRKKPFSCTICNQTFSGKSSLNNHYKLCQVLKLNNSLGERNNGACLNSSRPEFVCNLCTMHTDGDPQKPRFVYKSVFKKHMLTHVDQKVHKCETCGELFRHKGTFDAHKRKHTGEKPYKCDLCEKSYPQNGQLKVHIRSCHTGEKPFICNICGKGFSDKGHHKRHMFYHSGNRPFVCEVCKKSFIERGHLKQHMLIHSGITKDVCKICQKSFSTKANLKRHMLSHS